MNYNLLSLSQTPPLSVPLPYFLSAPLFLLLAGLALAFAPDTLFLSRWQPAMLALTHLLTLGFLGLCMLGAIQQVIPVLLGVVLPRPRLLSWTVFALWLCGTLLLVIGMYWGARGAIQAGGMILGATTLLFVAATGLAVRRSSSRHATRPAMGLALLGLLASVGLILWLLAQFHWQAPLAHPLTRLHIAWGLLLWVAALIIGVAYQVVPMFQLTSPYPLWLRRALLPLLLIAVAAWSLWPQWPWEALGIVCLMAFALTTLWLQQHRRRRLPDVTLDFWRVAMLGLLLACVAWWWQQWQPHGRLEITIGVLFLVGFAMAAVNGMLYKILPFLIWLHLNNRLQQAGAWQGKVPNMNQIIPQRQARWQWWAYLLALGMLLLAVWGILPIGLAGLAWMGNGGLLLWNLWAGVRVYHTALRAV